MSTAALVGAGPIGRAAVAALLEDEILSAVSRIADPNPDARRAVEDEFSAQAYQSAGDFPDADMDTWAIVAFSSRADAVGPVVAELLDKGYHAVTTCEELSDPVSMWRETLDTKAKEAGKVAIATGANPGFVMDRLVLAVAGGSRRFREVRVTRRIDTSERRGPLVAKSGRGLTAAEFAERARSGAVGHVGLAVSAKLVAGGLGWDITDISEDLQPVIGEDGRVAGLHQTALVTCDQGRLTYELRMAWELERPGDAIVVAGSPPLRVIIPEGFHGDTGTSAMVVNAVARGKTMAPGFYLPTQVPLGLLGAPTSR